MGSLNRNLNYYCTAQYAWLSFGVMPNSRSRTAVQTITSRLGYFRKLRTYFFRLAGGFVQGRPACRTGRFRSVGSATACKQQAVRGSLGSAPLEQPGHGTRCSRANVFFIGSHCSLAFAVAQWSKHSRHDVVGRSLGGIRSSGAGHVAV